MLELTKRLERDEGLGYWQKREGVHQLPVTCVKAIYQ
jgi:hypothetical protein